MRRTIASRLMAIAQRRAPDFVIGDPEDPYLRRWWVIPRNPIFNVYLHEIRKSDDDRALHDHPWPNMSWLLKGQYLEILPQSQLAQPCADFVTDDNGQRRFLCGHLRCEGFVIFRHAKTAHRLEVLPGGACWTLFITGPVLRSWGFRCAQGWRHWREFTAPNQKGQIGRGCD